jgi:hypothetical protein
MSRRLLPTTPLLVALLSLSLPLAAGAQLGTDVQPLEIPRAAAPPQLEDYTGGAAPATAGFPLTEFRQNAPGDGEPSSLPTTTYLSYDDHNIYAVFVCKDDPAKIRARMTKREDIFGDEGVEVFIDTYQDKQRSYVFAANPLGVQLDGIYTEGQGYQFTFDTIWYTKGKITSDGFVVIMTIPFKSLRFKESPTQTWGISVARIIPRNNEFVYWPYISNRLEGFVTQFATLKWTDLPSPGRNIQLIPYGVFANRKLLDFQGPDEGFGFDTKDEGRVGIDAKLVIRDAFTLDLTVNPDFSQVESDEPQVVVNQRYEVFFPEKRPFFLENAGFFTTPVNLFFSRRIGDPEYGARITGKSGDWVVGALGIDDRAPGRSLDPDSPYFRDRAEIGVARVRREFGRSHIGVFASNRSFADRDNQVVALDTRLRFDDNWAFTAQLIDTSTESDFEDLGGVAYLAQVDYGSRHLRYTGVYQSIDEEFRADLGFVPRIDIEQTRHTATYTWRPEKKKYLVSYGPTLDYQRTWNQAGDLQDWYADAYFTVDLTGATKLQVGRTEYFELYGFEFDYYTNYVIASSEWFKAFFPKFTYARGTGINYFPAAGVAPFLGDSEQLNLGFTWSPISQLRFDTTYIIAKLDTRGASPVPGADGEIFENQLLRTRVNYQFNLQWSLRAIVDYRSTKPNEDLVSYSLDKTWSGDLLLSYILNPGTAIYLGYTENRANLELTNTRPHDLLLTNSPDLTTGRQIFLKVSYLLRF